MNCQELTELVTEYLEGQMRAWDRVRFQLHLGLCGHCRAYLRQMRETIRTLGHLPPVGMPDEVRAELLDRFRDWKASRPGDGG